MRLPRSSSVVAGSVMDDQMPLSRSITSPVASVVAKSTSLRGDAGIAGMQRPSGLLYPLLLRTVGGLELCRRNITHRSSRRGRSTQSTDSRGRRRRPENERFATSRRSTASELDRATLRPLGVDRSQDKSRTPKRPRNQSRGRSVKGFRDVPQTSPRQAPVSCSRSSIRVLKLSRSLETWRSSKPRAVPMFSSTPSGSQSICTVTLV